MRLIQHSRANRDLSRSVSGPGHLFVAFLVGLLVLATVGEVIEPALMAEIEVDLLLSELGLESLMVSLPQWNLIELMLAAAALTGAVLFLRALVWLPARDLRSTPPAPGDKVPI